MYMVAVTAVTIINFPDVSVSMAHIKKQQKMPPAVDLPAYTFLNELVHSCLCRSPKIEVTEV